MAKKMSPFLIGIIIVGALMVINQGGFSFLGALLPSGEFRSNAGCTFLTNVPAGESYNQHQAWIAFDAGSGMQGFGKTGTASLNCDHPAINQIFDTTTIEGYRICTNIGSGQIFVEQTPGDGVITYLSSAGGNAILSCDVTCTDSSWSPSPSTVCSGSQFIQTSNCGNTRTAMGTKDCSTPPVCGDGTCEPGETCPADCGSTCPTMVELTSCRIIGDDELLMAASNWLNG